MVDERVKSQMNKIRSEMLAIIIYILIASIFVKIFMLGGNLKDVVTEYIIFIFVAIYQFLRARSLKVNMADLLPEKKKLIRREVIAYTIGATTFAIILLGFIGKEIPEVIEMTMWFIICFAGVRILIIKLTKRSGKKHEEEFDDAE
ncbi:MAG: hypothetical protein IKU80_04145 [Firmicutes bacterium]|nr:hypothetical protein [Bacillota bacterium]